MVLDSSKVLWCDTSTRLLPSRSSRCCLDPSSVRDSKAELGGIAKASTALGDFSLSGDGDSSALESISRLFRDFRQSIRYESLIERMNGALSSGGISAHSDGAINFNSVRCDIPPASDRRL